MTLEDEIKQLIIKSLSLEDIASEDIKDDEPLFEGGIGLDSIDALELGLALKKKYGLMPASRKEDNRKYYYSVKTIADYIRMQKNG